MRTRCFVAFVVLLLAAPAGAGVQKNLGAQRAPLVPLAEAQSAPPPNDRCEGAILIPCGNILLSGNTGNATNDYDFLDPLNSCTRFSAEGKDVVYKMSVGVGDSLWIDYRSIADASVYLVTDCSNVDGTCVAGSDSTSGPNSTERLTYKFAVPGVYYLILDSFGATSGDWNLVGQLVCGPSTPPSNDLCEAAQTISCGGFQLSGSTEFAHDDYSFSSTANSCTGQLADGRDVVYKLSAKPGDILWIDYTSTTDGSIYLVGNCQDIEGTCIAGWDYSGPGETEQMAWEFDFVGVYYVILDSRGAGSWGTWTASGEFICATVPPNDRCEDAIRIGCGDINLSGSTELANNDYWYSSAVVGCTEYDVNGKDVVYKVSANAGDSLWIDYLNSSDGAIYIVTDCSDIDSSCVYGVDWGLENEMERLRYRFPATGDYYVILDSEDLNTWGTWTAIGQLICSTVGVGGENPRASLTLHEIQPNPFRGRTLITYTLAFGGATTLAVYDLQGRVVRTLVDQDLPAGAHQVTWDGRDTMGRRAGAGVYFARLSNAGRDAIRRMVFVQ